MLTFSEPARTSRRAWNGIGKPNHRRVERQSAREREHLPGEVFSARGGHFDRLQSADILWVGQAVFQILRVPADDHQEIVEIVGYAAGELADRLHFLQVSGAPLRLLERGGGFPLGGDMAAHHIEQAVIFRQRPLQPAPTAVLVAEAIFQAHGRSTPGEPRAPCFRVRRVVRMAQFVHVHGPDFIAAPAEQPRPCRIDADEIAVEISDREQIFRDVPNPVALERAPFDFGAQAVRSSCAALLRRACAR